MRRKRMTDKEWAAQRRWEKSPAAKIYAEAARLRARESALEREVENATNDAIACAEERDALRAEVEGLRKALELAGCPINDIHACEDGDGPPGWKCSTHAALAHRSGRGWAMEGKAPEAFQRYADGCPFRLSLGVERRPRNALNVEIGQAMPRCKLRPPKHWGDSAPSALRWLASGGSPLVFGLCSRGGCPLKPDHCDSCGRMATSHFQVNGRKWPFDCRATGSPRSDEGGREE